MLIEANSDRLGQSEGLSGISCLGQTLHLELFELLAVGNLIGEVIDTGESLSEVAFLGRSQVTVVVREEVFCLLELISDLNTLVHFEGLFERGNCFAEPEDLLAG